MKISIAAKLFFGFLTVIFLNIFFVAVVSKLASLNSITNIMKRQSEIKNVLLTISTLHDNRRSLYRLYDKLGRKASAELFLENSQAIDALIDTISMHIDQIKEMDSTLEDDIPGSTISEAMMNRVIKTNILYHKDFKELVELPKTRGNRQQLGVLKKSIVAYSDSLAGYLSEVQSFLDNETTSRIRQIENRIDNAQKLTLVILASMSVFSLVFAGIFSQAMTNSLRRLKESASIIAKGNFDFDPSGYPGDEIGDLATAFFDMAYDLKNAQEELVKSKRLAAIGEVVASVNHEINNPLMIISGNAQFLEMSLSEATPETQERVKAIIEETERISRVTRKLREIKNPVVEDYTSSGEQMINLDKSAE